MPVRALRRREPVNGPPLWVRETLSRPVASFSVTVRFPRVVGTIAVPFGSGRRLNVDTIDVAPTRTEALNEPFVVRVALMRPTIAPVLSVSSPLQRLRALCGVPAVTTTFAVSLLIPSLTV